VADSENQERIPLDAIKAARGTQAKTVENKASANENPTMDNNKAPTQKHAADQDLELQRMIELADFDYVPRTELGRMAIAARREYFAAGGRPLGPEEIEREVAERRGGTHLLDDQ
jgi:hypothetical protein